MIPPSIAGKAIRRGPCPKSRPTAHHGRRRASDTHRDSRQTLPRLTIKRNTTKTKEIFEEVEEVEQISIKLSEGHNLILHFDERGEESRPSPRCRWSVSLERHFGVLGMGRTPAIDLSVRPATVDFAWHILRLLLMTAAETTSCSFS